MMHREQSPARVAVRVECPGTPRKPHRLETAEFQTPGIRAKELPAVSDVSTACPSSGGFQELDFGFGASRQHSGFGSVHDAIINLNQPSDFEAFKTIFGSGLADEAIADWEWEIPSTLHGEAPGSNMMHPSVAPALDDCPHTPRGAATRASDAKVPTVPHRHAAPCLLKALQQQNWDALMAALTEDPDSATMPFMEHNMEPPVCAAVRLGCPAAMVAALLECGANPEADDMRGNTAMRHLQQQKRSTASSAEYTAEVDALLLKHGAKHDCNSEPSVDELMLQGTLAQWSKTSFIPMQPSEAPGGICGALQPHREWHLQWTSEQVEDLVQLESMLRSEPVGGKHMAGVISSI